MFPAARKAVSSLLVLAFVGVDIAGAASQAWLVGGVSAKAGLVEIDPALGVVERHSANASGPVVIHIQDAHTNSSAQSSIAKILESLIERHGIDKILVEGGSGDVSLDFLRQYLPKERRERIAKKYLMNGELSGAEYLSIASDKKFKLEGIEENSLYEENLRSYARLVSERDRLLGWVNEAQKRADSLKRKFYPKETLAFDEAAQAFEKKKTDFTAYHEALSVAAKQAGLNPLAFPFFYSLKNLHELEAKARLSQENEKDLIAYLNAVKAFSSADVYRLLDEMEEMRHQIFLAALSSSPDALRLFSIDEHLTLSKKLILLQLSSQEYRRYLDSSENVEHFPIVLIAYLNRKLVDLGRFDEILKYDTLFETLEPQARAFYEMSFKRDQAFVERARLEAAKNGKALLVAGGFHAEHLKELFEKHGFRYVSVMPFMTHETNLERYEKILLSGIDSQTAGSTASNVAVRAYLNRVSPADGMFKEIGLPSAARLATIVGHEIVKSTNLPNGLRLHELNPGVKKPELDARFSGSPAEGVRYFILTSGDNPVALLQDDSKTYTVRTVPPSLFGVDADPDLAGWMRDYHVSILEYLVWRTLHSEDKGRLTEWIDQYPDQLTYWLEGTESAYRAYPNNRYRWQQPFNSRHLAGKRMKLGEDQVFQLHVTDKETPSEPVILTEKRYFDYANRQWRTSYLAVPRKVIVPVGMGLINGQVANFSRRLGLQVTGANRSPKKNQMGVSVMPLEPSAYEAFANRGIPADTNLTELLNAEHPDVDVIVDGMDGKATIAYGDKKVSPSEFWRLQLLGPAVKKTNARGQKIHAIFQGGSDTDEKEVRRLSPFGLDIARLGFDEAHPDQTEHQVFSCNGTTTLSLLFALLPVMDQITSVEANVHFIRRNVDFPAFSGKSAKEVEHHHTDEDIVAYIDQVRQSLPEAAKHKIRFNVESAETLLHTTQRTGTQNLYHKVVMTLRVRMKDGSTLDASRYRELVQKTPNLAAISTEKPLVVNPGQEPEKMDLDAAQTNELVTYIMNNLGAREPAITPVVVENLASNDGVAVGALTFQMHNVVPSNLASILLVTGLVRGDAAGVHEAIRRAMEIMKMDVLKWRMETGSKAYPDIRSALEKPSGARLASDSRKQSRMILNFGDTSDNTLAQNGGKGHNMVKLVEEQGVAAYRAKLGDPNARPNPPPFFVLTADGYQRFLEANGLHDFIFEQLQKLDGENGADIAESIQKAIHHADFPKDLEVAIENAYYELRKAVLGKNTLREAAQISVQIAAKVHQTDELVIDALAGTLTFKQGRESEVLSLTAQQTQMFKTYGVSVVTLPRAQLQTWNEESIEDILFSVAVRSSGTREDLEDAASAGIQETFLNVSGIENIKARIKDDFASLYGYRAIDYRDTQLVNAVVAHLGEKYQTILAALKTNSAYREFAERLDSKTRVSYRELSAMASDAQLRRDAGLDDILEELRRQLDVQNTASIAYDFLHPSHLSIAVVVQEYLKNDRSYTAFTTDNGWTALSFQKDKSASKLFEPRIIRLDVTWGKGESLVGGIISPDTYVIHIFTDDKGARHINILEKTLGTKKIQYMDTNEVLRRTGFTREEAVEILKRLNGEQAKFSDSFESKLGGAHATQVLAEIDRLAHLDIDEDTEIHRSLFERLALSRESMLMLSHVIKAFREKDVNVQTMKTYVPAAQRNAFAASDEEVKKVALEVYQKSVVKSDVRDLEGGLVRLKSGEAVPVTLQSRAYTGEKDTDKPRVYTSVNSFIEDKALEAAGAQFLAEGQVGRGAAVGRIFVIDESNGVPLKDQLKAGIKEAERLRTLGEKLIIFTRYTTPDYNPLMKLSAGVIALEGGNTSHAAIVSREYGIATVVGLGKFLDELKKKDAAKHKALLNYFRTNGNVVSIEANYGKIYKGALPVSQENVTVDIDKLPKLKNVKVGLIVQTPAASKKISKMAQYDGLYGVSLARAELILEDIGFHPRALEAYDNLSRDDNELDPRQLEDVEKLKGNQSLIEEIAKAVSESGERSAKEFYIQTLARGVATNAASYGLNQKVLYRATDFKQEEMLNLKGGHEFGKEEGDFMIGDRGIGYLLHENNRETFGWELEAIKRCVEMGYTNVGFFYPFVRTPEELERGLARINFPIQNVGAMVEVPSTVIQADRHIEQLVRFSRRTGSNVFLSIGTNDLTMLSRVADRENPRVKDFFREADPAVVKSIIHVALTIAKAQRDNPDISLTLGLCGQAIVKLANPKDPDYNPELAKKLMIWLDSVGTDPAGLIPTIQLGAEAEQEATAIDPDMPDPIEVPASEAPVTTIKADRIISGKELFSNTFQHPLEISLDEVGLALSKQIDAQTQGMIVFETPDFDSRELSALAKNEDHKIREVNPALGFGGLLLLLSPEYKPVLSRLFMALKEKVDAGRQIAILLTDVRDGNQLDHAIALMKEVGLEPGKNVTLGLRADTPDNYLIPQDYFPKIQFYAVDDDLLAQRFFAADRAHPSLPINSSDERLVNLKPVKNMLSHAAAQYGVKYLTLEKTGARLSGKQLWAFRNYLDRHGRSGKRIDIRPFRDQLTQEEILKVLEEKGYQFSEKGNLAIKKPEGARLAQDAEDVYRVAVVGAGASGIAAAVAARDQLLRAGKKVKVRVYDALPRIGGLIVYGIRFDKEKMKDGLLKVREAVFEDGSIEFMGNVEVGKHVSAAELMEGNDAVVFATGADESPLLGITNEEYGASVLTTPGKKLVFYNNRRPSEVDLNFDLGKRAALVGVGNVAADVLYILLTKMGLKEVDVLGRRGAAQNSFSLRELQYLDELVESIGLQIIVDPRGFETAIEAAKVLEAQLAELGVIVGAGTGRIRRLDSVNAKKIENLKTQYKRATENVEWFKRHIRRDADGKPISAADVAVDSTKPTVRFLFQAVPTKNELNEAKKVTGLTYDQADLAYDSAKKEFKAKNSGKLRTLPVDSVLYAIPDQSRPIEGLPFDEEKKLIPTEGYRVKGLPEDINNAFAAGWATTGAQGLVGYAAEHGTNTGNAVAEFLLKRQPKKIADQDLADLIRQQRSDVVDFNDYKRLRTTELIERERLRGEFLQQAVRGDHGEALKNDAQLRSERSQEISFRFSTMEEMMGVIREGRKQGLTAAARLSEAENLGKILNSVKALKNAVVPVLMGAEVAVFEFGPASSELSGFLRMVSPAEATSLSAALNRPAHFINSEKARQSDLSKPVTQASTAILLLPADYLSKDLTDKGIRNLSRLADARGLKIVIFSENALLIAALESKLEKAKLLGKIRAQVFAPKPGQKTLDAVQTAARVRGISLAQTGTLLAAARLADVKKLGYADLSPARRVATRIVGFEKQAPQLDEIVSAGFGRTGGVSRFYLQSVDGVPVILQRLVDKGIQAARLSEAAATAA